MPLSPARLLFAARTAFAFFALVIAAALVEAADLAPGVRKLKDVVIYEDAKFYAAFPSVVRRPDGEVLVAFRRAPARMALGEKRESHVDPNSFLVSVRSRDGRLVERDFRGHRHRRGIAPRLSFVFRYKEVRRVLARRHRVRRGHAMRLPDQRVLLVYGYRHKPFGIRARILNAECTDFATAPESVLREDGGTTDIGYPWAVQLDGRRVLVTYYFNLANGPRHIAGTVLEID